MARTARLVLPGQPHHVYQQGNNKQTVFLDREDYLAFLNWLRQASRQFKVDIHTYALLHNAFHLLVTPSDETGLARMMQWIGRFYVPYFNKKYKRSGTLWEGRFRTSLVEADKGLLECSRFIELKPVLTGQVTRLEEYEWSGYLHHAGIKPDSIIKDHAVYWNLGNTPFAREMAYQDFFKSFDYSESDKMDRILMSGWPFGTEEFKKRLEIQTERPFRMGKRGRPRKNIAE